MNLIKQAFSFIPALLGFNTLDLHNADFLINHVKQSIEKAESQISKLDTEILQINGMSSPKVRHLLNNLCALKDCTYLEIGPHQGSTYISALYKNNLMRDAIAIDNWSEYGNHKETLLSNIAKFLTGSHVRYFDVDAFDLNKSQIFKYPINIYFYDGNPSIESQEKAFTYYNDLFAPIFIAVVDDWNAEDIKMGTRQAFEKLNYKILYQIALPARDNGDLENWWNGLYVAVIAK